MRRERENGGGNGKKRIVHRLWQSSNFQYLQIFAANETIHMISSKKL